MSEPPTPSNLLLQKRLRFLLRAYIACWLGFYFAIKKQTILFDAYIRLAQHDALAWLTPMAFVWIAGTLTLVPIAVVYWWLTRPPQPEASWREIVDDETLS